jgi:hypothetical protein
MKTSTMNGQGQCALEKITFNPFFVMFGHCGNFHALEKKTGIVWEVFETEEKAEAWAKVKNDEAHEGSIYRLQIVADGAPRWQTAASSQSLEALETILHTKPQANECSRIIGPDNASHAASHCNGCCHLSDVGMTTDPNREKALA